MTLRAAHRLGVDLTIIDGPSHPRHRLAALLARHEIDVVLDVGANVGQYALSLRKFGYRGRIVSFEPMRHEHAQLEAHTADDGRWTSVNMALGDGPGVATINVAGNSISSSMLPMLESHASAAPRSSFVEAEEIRTERLDAIFDSLVSPDERAFLKLDTQGFERQVLAGAGATVSRLAGIQIEMSVTPLYEGQMLVTEAFDKLASFGMSLWEVERTFVRPDDQRLLQLDGIFFRDP